MVHAHAYIFHFNSSGVTDVWITVLWKFKKTFILVLKQTSAEEILKISLIKSACENLHNHYNIRQSLT